MDFELVLTLSWWNPCHVLCLFRLRHLDNSLIPHHTCTSLVCLYLYPLFVLYSLAGWLSLSCLFPVFQSLYLPACVVSCVWFHVIYVKCYPFVWTLRLCPYSCSRMWQTRICLQPLGNRFPSQKVYFSYKWANKRYQIKLCFYIYLYRNSRVISGIMYSQPQI